ncbi:MAG: hypothetical protein R3282_09890, partial [Rhodothermales bacterium]|nr:hypothetical protein [Rhodothermales bacterium]
MTADTDSSGRGRLAAEPAPGRIAAKILKRWATRVGFTGRGLVVLIPYCWLLLFFLIPFAIVLKISVSQLAISIPPYTPLLRQAADGAWELKVYFDNFLFLLEDSLYWVAYLNSVKIAAISTVLCLLLGYPMAYGIARAPASWRNVLLMMVILPFWTSFLLRVY